MTADEPSDPELTEAMDAIVDRVDATLAATGEQFPFVADIDTGEWETTEDGNWCGGHWVGLLWLASDHATGDRADRFRTAAYEHAATLREAMPHTTMFCGMNFHHAGFDGYDVTGDRSLFGLGLTGADAMIELFDGEAQQIRVGNYRIKGPAAQFDMEREVEGRPTGEHVAVLDTIHTSQPVLWRAYRETNDPRYRDVAVSHTNRHIDWYLKPDGSTIHMAEFDPETGEPTDWFDTLAYSPDTCWARGQGWHISGLARAYTETGLIRYRTALDRSVDYYLEQTPADLVPYWDFEDPRIPDVPRDTSSAGIAANGLVRLPATDEHVAPLRATGERIIGSIIDSYLVRDGEHRGMVQHGCYNMPGDYATDNELVWTDYYVARAIDELLG